MDQDAAGTIFTWVIKFRINQDFLIEHSCILHIRSNLSYLYILTTNLTFKIPYLFAWQHSAVSNMSDCRSRGLEFDLGPVPFFHRLIME